MDLFARLGIALKAFALTFQRSGAAGLQFRQYGTSRRNFADVVGDGRGNSIVVSVIDAIATAFTEPPLIVIETKSDGTEEEVPNHPLTLMLRRPNRYFGGSLLRRAVVADRAFTGNGYLYKMRSGAGRPVGAWYIPSWMIEPKWPQTSGNTEFISYYEYTVDGRKYQLPTEDIIHFRYGIDPDNPRKGLSPLYSVLREIFTDNEATNYVATILYNLGIPGLVIRPKEGTINKDQAEQVKEMTMQKFSGDRRGEPLVLGGAADVSVISFSPNELNVDKINSLSEERISAVFGAPAIIVGLGAGLEHSIYNNFHEARSAFWEKSVIPQGQIMCEDLDAQLLGDFSDTARFRVAFDLSTVRALQDNQNDLFTRVDRAVAGGWYTVNEARELTGRDQLPGANVLYVPIRATPMEPSALLTPVAAPVPIASPSTPPPVGAESEAEKVLSALEFKAANQIPPAIRRVRSRLQPAMERELRSFLQDQLADVLAETTKTLDAGIEVKALSVGSLFRPRAWDTKLREILSTFARRVMDSVESLVGNLLDTDATISDADVRRYLRAATINVAGINDHTRDVIRAALIAGQEAGETLEQIAKRIEDSSAFSAARSVTIARTEIGQASNLASLAAYGASGSVLSVRVTDGTEHDEPCASLNGRELTLEEAASIPPLEHPNCVRAFIPLTRPAKSVHNGNGRSHVDDVDRLAIIAAIRG